MQEQNIPDCFIERNSWTINSTDYTSFDLETRITTEVLTSSLYQSSTKTYQSSKLDTDNFEIISSISEPTKASTTSSLYLKDILRSQIISLKSIVGKDHSTAYESSSALIQPSTASYSNNHKIKRSFVQIQEDKWSSTSTTPTRNDGKSLFTIQPSATSSSSTILTEEMLEVKSDMIHDSFVSKNAKIHLICVRKCPHGYYGESSNNTCLSCEFACSGNNNDMGNCMCKEEVTSKTNWYVELSVGAPVIIIVACLVFVRRKELFPCLSKDRPQSTEYHPDTKVAIFTLFN